MCVVCAFLIFCGKNRLEKCGRTGSFSLSLPVRADICSISLCKCGELSVYVKSTVKEQ